MCSLACPDGSMRACTRACACMYACLPARVCACATACVLLYTYARQIACLHPCASAHGRMGCTGTTLGRLCNNHLDAEKASAGDLHSCMYASMYACMCACLPASVCACETVCMLLYTCARQVACLHPCACAHGRMGCTRTTLGRLHNNHLEARKASGDDRRIYT